MSTTRTFFFGGEEYVGSFNNNGELNQPVEGLDRNLLINAPRLGHRSKGEPIIDAGNGVRLLCGTYYMNAEEKEMKKAWEAAHRGNGGGNSTGGTGNTNARAKALDSAAREILAVLEAHPDIEVSETSVATLRSQVIETQTEKVVKAVATMSEAEKAALRAALGL